MNEETYYTVLNLGETASPSEIKTAYRDLIKQVHPDTIFNSPPYLRRIAEEKAKEITEAYSVLSSSGKRREYDRQLAEYRRQTTREARPRAAPPPSPSRQASSQTSSGLQCKWCGSPLYRSGGFCRKCNKFTAPAGSSPQPTGVRWFGYQLGHGIGYGWEVLGRWVNRHPILAVAIPMFCLLAISSSMTNTAPKPPVQANLASSPSTPIVPAAVTTPVASEGPVPTKPGVSVSGSYSGPIHNKTMNVSSSFAVVFHEKKDGSLEGCMDVHFPLYGKGPLQGSIRGTHLSFVVADISFEGNASKDGISGSYVVNRQDGNQFGDFRLLRQNPADALYTCVSGVLAEIPSRESEAPSSQRSNDVSNRFKALPPPGKSHLPQRAVVIGTYYSTLHKRCAFLPSENYSRCGFGPEVVAELKAGDRVTVMSPLTRAENSDEIYKVRTEQGWVGWIDARGVTLDPQ
jgi:hypothetical protein